jgi:GT2 family glycosyltransferase
VTAPRFSVVLLPTTDEGGDTNTEASLDRQGFPSWELLRATSPDAMSVHRTVRGARGEFVMFVSSGDSLEPHTFAAVDAALTDDVDLLYTDEDVLDGPIHRDPFYKPDWSPERLRNQHYTGRLAAYRRTVLEDVGGVRPEADIAFEFDVALRVGEQARHVVHLPDAVYHRATPAPAGSEFGHDAVRMIEEALQRTGAHFAVEPGDPHPKLVPALRENPTVSIVIPTAGVRRHVRGTYCCLVENCVRALVESSTYTNYEIVCVYDRETEPGTLTALHEVAGDRLRLVEYTSPFNFSHKINLGAVQSDGDFLLLLNDDTETRTPSWIEHMLAFALDDHVGAVGAKLLFGDNRIQHAGVVLYRGNPGHPYYGYPAEHSGYHLNLEVAANCLAVTAACLLVRRSHFDLVGGFAGVFPRNYNDVDFCLKLHAKGLRNVFTPYAVLSHYESSSRGMRPVEPEERFFLEERWGAQLAHDPYYNPNFLAGANYLTLVAPDGRPAPQRGLG